MILAKVSGTGRVHYPIFYIKETAKYYDLAKPYGWIYSSEVKMLMFESQLCALLAINLP